MNRKETLEILQEKLTKALSMTRVPFISNKVRAKWLENIIYDCFVMVQKELNKDKK